MKNELKIIFSADEYSSKLFLDCCGLVRQVVRDLAKDFGFVIGPWNQAYMFDTLPHIIESEKDMKPGDLVFMSGTYVNPKCKYVHPLRPHDDRQNCMSSLDSMWL